jgi:ABC-type branched-subunit amino acid transport system substrate-binding protein
MKKLCFVVSVSLFLLGFIFISGIQAAEKAIPVGLSLVYSGSSAATGSSVSNGLLDHLMWINNQGGIEYRDPKSGKMERIKMKIIWEDNAYNPSKSVSIYKRFKAAEVKVVLVFGSPTGEAISASLSRDRIPGIAMYAYASPAGYRPQPLYYASGSGTTVESFATMVKWFMSTWKESRPPRIGLISADIPSWRILGDPEGAKAQVERLGGRWVGMEWVPMISTDNSVQISRLLQKGIDVICSYGGVPNTIILAKDLARLNVDVKKIKVICNSSSWNETLLQAIPREGEGFYGEISGALVTENVPGVRLAKEVAKWRGRKPEEVNNTYLPGFTWGYSLKAALRNALEKAGPDQLTPTDVRDALFSLKNADTGGLDNVTVEDSNFPTFSNHTRYSIMEKGQFRIISDWVKSEKVQYGRR